MIVTGIGSRETPPEILKVMFWLGEAIVNDGSILRSGGAPGADQAFESGASASMLLGEKAIEMVTEIYLPWASFEYDNRSWIPARLTEPADWTYEIAAEFHPRWQYLKQGAKKLHARNVHQVLGATQPFEYTDAIICWTKDAKGGGGTGQALRIAQAYEVPIFDLANREDLVDVWETWFPGIPLPSELG